MIKIALILDPWPSHGVATNLISEALNMVRVAEQLQSVGYSAALVVGVPLLNELRIRVGGHIRFVVGGREEREVFEKYLRRWDLNAVDDWQAVCAGDSASIEQYRAWLKSVRDLEFSFDVAFVWGSNSSLVAAVGACGLTAISVQAGPATWPFPDLLSFAINTTPNYRAAVSGRPSPLKILDTYSAQQLLANLNGDAIQFDNLEGLWNDEVANVLAVEKRFTRVILFVGERRDSLSSCSRTSRETEQIDQLIEACAAHNALLLIKPPKGTRELELNERHWRNLSLKWRNNRTVIELVNFPENLRPALLASVNGVVAFSPEVLFEAMLFDRPVHELANTVFFGSHSALSLEEVVSGRFSKNVYREAVATTRDFIIRNMVVSADRFFTGDGAAQLLSRLDLYDQFRARKSESIGTSRVALTNESAKIFQGTSYGKFVGNDAGHQLLELESGDQFVVTVGFCIGKIETIKLEETGVLLTGWTFVRKAQTTAPFFIAQYGKNKFLCATAAVERIDIATKYDDEALRFCGFQFFFSFNDLDANFSEQIQLFAYHSFGCIERIRL